AVTSQATQTGPTTGRKRRGLFARLASGLTSLAGFMTAIATIAASVSAILGLYVHHQGQQLQQAHTQVSHQAQQITELRQKVTTTAPSPATTPSPGPGAQVSGQGNYLSSMTPTVNNSGYNNGAQVMSAKSYPSSVQFSCVGGSASQPDIAYNVAGKTTFTAEIGIPDDTSNATDVVATLTFSDESDQQVGKPVQVSLGHAVNLSLNIKGVTQLGITCNGIDQANNQASSQFEVALGSAAVS
ncbi:MAG: hypothetical protein ACRDN0_27930, partial [Trebonia sp.]